MMFLANCEGWPGLAAAREALAGGRLALDAVEAGIKPVEAEPTVESVGRGGTPDLLGTMACDAAIMDGETLGAGAVGALRGFLHAISVARAVMERLPHVMLVADGAARFAREIGAEPAELLTPKAREKYERWVRENVPAELQPRLGEVGLAEYAWKAGRELEGASNGERRTASGEQRAANDEWRTARGTVVLLSRDGRGRIAAGASTSGWACRYPGRLGDSPIIGAGLYADSRFGACGCTHVGEMTIRASTARSVVQYMKTGMSVEEACREAMRDLSELKGGLLGPVVVHAIDVYGNPCVVSNADVGKLMGYYCWREGMAEPELARAEVMERS